MLRSLMPHAPRFLFGAVLLAAGLAGLAMWFHGDVSRNSGYGMFMLSIMGLLAGAHSLLSVV